MDAKSKFRVNVCTDFSDDLISSLSTRVLLLFSILKKHYVFLTIYDTINLAFQKKMYQRNYFCVYELNTFCKINYIISRDNKDIQTSNSIVNHSIDSNRL